MPSPGGRQAGRILKRVTGDNTDGSTNVVPIMDAKQLHSGYKKLMSTLYSPRVYYQRVKTFLSHYQPPKINLHLDFQYVYENLRAFLRSIVLLGIFGKERKEYWKLFFWSLLHRPSVFPLAIVFSIYGYHFRKISELI